jgi:hypothetical protein
MHELGSSKPVQRRKNSQCKSRHVRKPKTGVMRYPAITAHALTGLQRGLTVYDSACNFGARNG